MKLPEKNSNGWGEQLLIDLNIYGYRSVVLNLSERTNGSFFYAMTFFDIFFLFG